MSSHRDDRQKRVHMNQLIPRMRDEYIRWPRLALTTPQAARLWHTDPRTCETALDMLVRTGFLTRREDNRFGRADAPYERWCP